MEMEAVVVAGVVVAGPMRHPNQGLYSWAVLEYASRAWQLYEEDYQGNRNRIRERGSAKSAVD